MTYHVDHYFWKQRVAKEKKFYQDNYQPYSTVAPGEGFGLLDSVKSQGEIGSRLTRSPRFESKSGFKPMPDNVFFTKRNAGS